MRQEYFTSPVENHTRVKKPEHEPERGDRRGKKAYQKVDRDFTWLWAQCASWSESTAIKCGSIYGTLGSRGMNAMQCTSAPYSLRTLYRPCAAARRRAAADARRGRIMRIQYNPTPTSQS